MPQRSHGTRESGCPCSGDDGTGSSQSLRVNLGCGYVYKPGFVNLDRNESSAADLLADVLTLPFRDGSVDVVEADQLLEHFDVVHSRIVLWECHRVLAEDGIMVIETPDLQKAVGSLLSAKPSRHESELQWIYGLDSPGLQHRTGFTRKSLKRMLEEASFGVVAFEKPRTHTYEPGLRVVCKRLEPSDRLKTAVMRAMTSLARDDSFGDSFVLVPLYEEMLGADARRREDEMELLSMACVLNPRVAAAILAAIDRAAGTAREDLAGIIERLAGARLHERAFTLWKRSVRRQGGSSEFRKFTERLAKDVRTCLEDRGMEPLRYVLSLDPTPIRLLEHRLAMVEGQRAASYGVRMFASCDYDHAMESFREALAINPADFPSAVNLGRLMAIRGEGPTEVEEMYQKAIALAPGSLRNRIEKECVEYRATGRTPNTPFFVQ